MSRAPEPTGRRAGCGPRTIASVVLVVLVLVVAVLGRQDFRLPFTEGDGMYIVVNWDPRVDDLGPLLDQIGDNGPTREDIRDAIEANQARSDAVRAAILDVLDEPHLVNMYEAFDRAVFLNVRGSGDVRDLQDELRTVADDLGISFTITHARRGNAIAHSGDLDEPRFDGIERWRP